MVEWLRRWTRNPLGSPCASSNTADYGSGYSFCFLRQLQHLIPNRFEKPGYKSFNTKKKLPLNDHINDTGVLANIFRDKCHPSLTVFPFKGNLHFNKKITLNHRK